MKCHGIVMTRYSLLVLLTGMVFGCSAPVNDSNSMIGKCPQPRFTDKAPAAIYNRTNPLTASAASINAGEKLFQADAGPVPCMQCHGKKGDGRGAMAHMFDPPPRNFCCAETINGVPDGQLFWIIKNGSPGTSMPGFGHLSDTEIWQIVQYIRRLSDDLS